MEKKTTEKGYLISEDNFKLVASTQWGSCCYDGTFPNKTKAIEHGRFLKRNHYCFSYLVYGQQFVKEDGKKYRTIIHRG